MLTYQLISGICFFGCLGNVWFLWYIDKRFQMPPHIGRTHYVFFVTQFISIVIQFATFLHPQNEWILKALSVAVWADAFSFCWGIYKHGIKK